MKDARGETPDARKEEPTFLVTVQIKIPDATSADDAIIWMYRLLALVRDPACHAHVVSARPKGRVT